MKHRLTGFAFQGPYVHTAACNATIEPWDSPRMIRTSCLWSGRDQDLKSAFFANSSHKGCEGQKDRIFPPGSMFQHSSMQNHDRTMGLPTDDSNVDSLVRSRSQLISKMKHGLTGFGTLAVFGFVFWFVFGFLSLLRSRNVSVVRKVCVWVCLSFPKSERLRRTQSEGPVRSRQPQVSDRICVLGQQIQR